MEWLPGAPAASGSLPLSAWPMECAIRVWKRSGVDEWWERLKRSLAYHTAVRYHTSLAWLGTVTCLFTSTLTRLNTASSRQRSHSKVMNTERTRTTETASTSTFKGLSRLLKLVLIAANTSCRILGLHCVLHLEANTQFKVRPCSRIATSSQQNTSTNFQSWRPHTNPRLFHMAHRDHHPSDVPRAILHLHHHFANLHRTPLQRRWLQLQQPHPRD